VRLEIFRLSRLPMSVSPNTDSTTSSSNRFPPNKAHGNYHSTNALKQVCAALRGYAFSQGSPPLNVEESKALSTYCNRTLPRAYPPGTTPRYPVRLALLEEARVAREARAAADPSLAWAAIRDTTYFMVAH
jgi:hypothetical protein